MSDMDMKAMLEKQLAELEAGSENDMVPMSQVRTLMGEVKKLFQGDFSDIEIDGDLYGELGELAKFINTAKKELREFSPHDLADKQLPDASDQLDAIVQTTEKATSQIMDSVERVQDIHAQMRDRLVSMDPPIDADVMAGVDDALMESETNLTNIYEACNFQDLTGQRIMKIVNAIREVERQVLRMIVAFGIQKDEIDDETRKEMEEDLDLLNGPQLPGQSLAQDDIDDILSKLL